MKRQLINAVIVAVLALAGVLTFLYPTIAAWRSQIEQSSLIQQSYNSIDSANPAKEEQLAAAHRYNDALSSGALVKAHERKALGTGYLTDDSQEIWDYADILKMTSDGMMGRIKISSADIDLPIYHTSSDEALLKGAGHLQGTSLPVGGIGTRSVVTAHRGLASAKMFTDLDRVKEGDEIVLEIFGEVYTYRVFETRVIEPDDTDAIRPDPERDLLTLITCTPLGINTQRILVTGERITPTPQADLDNVGAPSELPRFPWWPFVLAGTFILIALWLWWNYRVYRRNKAALAAKTNESEERPDNVDTPENAADNLASAGSLDCVGSADSAGSVDCLEDPDRVESAQKPDTADPFPKHRRQHGRHARHARTFPPGESTSAGI